MGRLEKTVANDEETTRIVYDNLGRKVKEISPNLYNSSYDNLAAHTYSADVGTRYTYKVNSLLETVKDAQGNVTTYLEYDLYGNVLKEKKPNASVYKKEFDCMNRLTKVWFKNYDTDPDASYKQLEGYIYEQIAVTSSGITKNGTQKTQTIYSNNTVNTLTTKYIYDFDDRLVKQINNNNTEIITEYYKNGAKFKTQDSNGTTTTYYDGLNRVNRIESPFENISGTIYYSVKRTEYDNSGNVIWEENKSNKPLEADKHDRTEYEYNNRNLLTKVTLKVNDTLYNYTQYYYDEEGRKVRQYTGLSSPLTITALDSLYGSDTDYAVDVLITGDKDFAAVDIDRPEILTPTDFCQNIVTGKRLHFCSI
jgi:hypothetical protein